MAEENGKVPKWEEELWEYLSSGDGTQCPDYYNCQDRLEGSWCISDNVEVLERLLEARRFDSDKYEFIRCGEKHGRVFELVERLAESFLERVGAQYPPVPSAFTLLADEDTPIEIRLVPLKRYHGAIWYLNDGWVIQVNANDSPARRRLSIYHEVFHMLAHRKTTPVFRHRGCEGGSFNEMLADYFACCILMPRKWVKATWGQVWDLGRMTKIFCVEKPVMWLRLREMGLI